MTQYAYELDEKGFIKDNYIVGGPVEVPKGSITIQLPQPLYLYKPRWVERNWVEGATQEEIEEMIKPLPQAPTLEEQLAERDKQIIELKAKQILTEQLVEYNSTQQQELLELLIDMGVI